MQVDDGSVLWGRDDDLARLGDWVGHVQAGRGGSVVLTGPAGIGKSRLADEVAAGFDGVVVRVRPTETDPPVPFDALSQLLEPFHHHLDVLPERQRRALLTAIGVLDEAGDGPRGDRLAIGLAALTVIRRASERDALLLLIDDVQHLDPGSIDSLGFCLRRLDDRRVGVMCTHRSGTKLPTPLRGVPSIRLAPLSPAASEALVRASVPQVAPRVLDEVVILADGNPLVLRELAGSLDREQLLGVQQADLTATLATRSQHLFHGVVTSLPADVRTALVLRALIRSSAVTVLPAALQRCGIDPAGIRAAVDQGVLEGGADAHFAHPLARAAVLALASAMDVRRAHAVLAEVAEDDDRVWHRRELTSGCDDALADDLEAAARTAARRGALHASLRALDAAADMSSAPEVRARRMLDGLELAIRTNSRRVDIDRRVQALRRARPDDYASERFELISALVAHELRRPIRPVIDRLEVVAGSTAAAGHPLAPAMYADVAYLSLIAGDCLRADGAAALAREQLQRHPPDADRAAPTLATSAMAAACRGRPDEAREFLAALSPLVGKMSPHGNGVIAIPLAMLGLGMLGEYRQMHQLASMAVAASNANQALSALPTLTQALGEASYRLGNWDDADAELSDAFRLSREFDQTGTLVHVQAAYGRLLAHRGRMPEAEALFADVERAARHAGAGFPLAVVGHARGAVHLAAGRFDVAATAFESVLVNLIVPSGLLEPSWVPVYPDVVEALALSGRMAEAVQRVDELRACATSYPRPSVQALVARAAALVATERQQELFDEAIELHTKEPVAHEPARTRLLAGEAAIADGASGTAREHLQVAVEQFAALGAEPWLLRAEAGLRRAGARSAPRQARSTELSQAERRVADAVASGLTNKQIAELLFVSVKTIEFHLSRIYAKLGVRGRAALARCMLTADPPNGGHRR